METPSTLITGKNLHREIAVLNPDICDIDSAKNLCELTLFNVKNLHDTNINCNFVS